MPNWRNEYRTCGNCRGEYRPQREAQSYCSPRCSSRARVARHRLRSRYIDAPLTVLPEKPLQPAQPPATRVTEAPVPHFNPLGPTPGALQGDDHPLEYYDDGYPKLPACLDRALA